jgi:hypothetical protein
MLPPLLIAYLLLGLQISHAAQPQALRNSTEGSSVSFIGVPLISYWSKLLSDANNRRRRF